MTEPAELALGRLSIAYAVAVDDRDAPGFCRLFGPDAELTVHLGPAGSVEAARRYRGHDELATIIDAVGQYVCTLHRPSSLHVVTAEGERATAVSSCIAHHLDRDGRDLVMALRYRDAFERDGAGGWRFAHRAVHRLWTREVEVEVAAP